MDTVAQIYAAYDQEANAIYAAHRERCAAANAEYEASLPADIFEAFVGQGTEASMAKFSEAVNESARTMQYLLIALKASTETALIGAGQAA